MASVAHLRIDAENILDEVEKRFKTLEENAIAYFTSARHMQRLFRGYITRKHISMLNEQALIIQKNWRAFLGRIEYRRRLKEKYDDMCWTYYNFMAKTIQRFWRGHWVRAKVFSYYELKSWLEFVRQQNLSMKTTLHNYHKERLDADEKAREDEAKEWIIYILFKLHHLIRTRQIKGVYSLSNSMQMSDVERMLKALKYKDFMTFYNSYVQDVRERKAKEMPEYILQRCKYPSHFEREWHEHKKPHKDLIFTRGSYISPKLKMAVDLDAGSEGDAKGPEMIVLPIMISCQCNNCRMVPTSE